MKSILSRFRGSLIIFSIALALLGFVSLYLFPGAVSSMFSWLLLLMVALTYLSFYLVRKASMNKFSRFANYIMASGMIRMLLLAFVIVVYALLNRDDVLRFGLTLLVLYFCYLVFEVVWLLKLSRELN
jgi:hypothetical protein